MAYSVRRGSLKRDKESLLKFWRDHGTKPLDNKFEWMYVGNPYGEAFFWLLIDERNGEVVGSSAVFPREITIKGLPRRAGIAGDLLIHKNHRTLGPVLMLMREVYEKAGKADFDVVYTLPNKSADLLAQRVGYKKIGSLNRCVNLFKVKQQLVKRGVPNVVAEIISPALEVILSISRLKLPRSLKTKLQFQQLHNFDERFTELWENYSSNYLVSPNRSVKYMNWKYFGDPDDVNRVYASFSADGERMLACMVFCKSDKSVEIRELIIHPEVECQKGIAYKFIRHIQKKEVESVFMNIIDNNNLPDLLSNLGFTVRGSGRNIRYACFADDLEEEVLSNSNNWIFVRSDEDT